MESVCAVVCLGFPITGLSGVRVVSKQVIPVIESTLNIIFLKIILSPDVINT